MRKMLGNYKKRTPEQREKFSKKAMNEMGEELAKELIPRKWMEFSEERNLKLESQNSNLFQENIELRKDKKDLESHLNSIQQSLESNLELLDEDKLARFILEEFGESQIYNGTEETMAKMICYKFGTKKVSVEEIKKVLIDNIHEKILFDLALPELSQAIVNYINGKKHSVCPD